MEARMRRLALIPAVACLAFTAGGPAWVKLDAALQQSAATGKLVAVYTNVDKEGGGC
jgi:hypothetical protein